MADQYDSPWNVILHHHFQEFMEFFFPDLYELVDWSRGWEFCDKDLRKIDPKAPSKQRRADKIVKVWFKDGSENVLFIHVEVQMGYDSQFEKRMYQYNYRAYDLYDEPVVSLAVIGDDDRPHWCPDLYERKIATFRLEMEYPVVKLQDYNGREEELEASSNIFATVTLAHLATRETEEHGEARLYSKLALVRRLFEKGFERREMRNLFRFIDWVMDLPGELDQRFNEELSTWDRRQEMEYISSFERNAMEKGRLEGEARILKRQLTRRHGELPGWAVERLDGAGTDELERWGERLLDAQRLDDVFAEPRDC